MGAVSLEVLRVPFHSGTEYYSCPGSLMPAFFLLVLWVYVAQPTAAHSVMRSGMCSLLLGMWAFALSPLVLGLGSLTPCVLVSPLCPLEFCHGWVLVGGLSDGHKSPLPQRNVMDCFHLACETYFCLMHQVKTRTVLGMILQLRRSQLPVHTDYGEGSRAVSAFASGWHLSTGSLKL